MDSTVRYSKELYGLVIGPLMDARASLFVGTLSVDVIGQYFGRILLSHQ